MGQIVELQKKPTIDFPEEIYTPVPVAVLNNNTDTLLCSLTTKPGKRAYLVLLAATIDAAAQPFVTYTFLQDGIPLFPFSSNQNQFSDPTFPTRMPYRYPLKQVSIYSIVARVSASGPASANAVGRFVIEYEDF
jgi:hypothetical protein